MVREILRRRPAATLLALLLAALPVFIAADLAYAANWSLLVGHHRFEVDGDRSFIELFGYGQLILAVTILGVIWRRPGGSPVHLAWGIALGVVCFDDMLEGHERGGALLARVLDLQPAAGLRAVDFGELIMFALIGTAVLCALGITHLRSDGRARRESLAFGGIVALLAIPAIGVDMLGIALRGHVADGALVALTLAEAAGELAVMSLVLAWAVHVLVCRSARSTQTATTERQPTVAPSSVPTT